MIRFQIAYRFQNNAVKGYVQGRFTALAAENACIQGMINDCNLLNEEFDRKRLITSNKSVTKKELAKIQEDWRIGRGLGILAVNSDFKKARNSLITLQNVDNTIQQGETEMTLQEWADKNNVGVSTWQKEGYDEFKLIADRSYPTRFDLFRLIDYVVTSVEGGTIWLKKRNNPITLQSVDYTIQ